jgi:hypothetical protein
METSLNMTTTTTVLDRSVGITDPGLVDDDDDARRPDPEVPERARRRTFTAKYKLEVLAAYDAAPAGEKGAVLRRESLYSSHIVEWRRARDVGALAGLTQPRGRPKRDRQQERITHLEADKRRLEQDLAKANFVVDVQAKLHALLETISEGADTEPRSKK